MGLESLLGNGQLKENLSAALSQNRISHGYLISGPQGAGKRTLARLLAAAAVCENRNRPCGACPACRKVFSDSHPDVITVDDPEKKTVSVDLIRQARRDMYIRPNEAGRKVYIFPRAQDMRPEAQNALLKVLEEPPSYGMFLLLADLPEKLLTTVRSRCVELKLKALPEALLQSALKAEFPQASNEDISAAIWRSGGFLGQAKQLLAQGENLLPQTSAFVSAYADKDALAMLTLLTAMEKWKREDFLSAMRQWHSLLVGGLSCRAGVGKESTASRQIGTRRSGTDIYRAIAAVQKAVEYAQANVSVGAICAWLSWELR